MKDNLDNAIEFLANNFERLLSFFLLMSLIAIISMALISLFNVHIAYKVFCINISIGVIPFVIDFLLFIILDLIERIIYGED